MQENQPSDNDVIGQPVHPEAKKAYERLQRGEPLVPLRNDRPVEIELNVRCEDGFTIGFNNIDSMKRIIKLGYLEEAIRKFRNKQEEDMQLNLKKQKEQNANTGTSSE